MAPDKPTVAKRGQAGLRSSLAYDSGKGRPKDANLKISILGNHFLSLHDFYSCFSALLFSRLATSNRSSDSIFQYLSPLMTDMALSPIIAFYLSFRYGFDAQYFSRLIQFARSKCCHNSVKAYGVGFISFFSHSNS
jgi:hypothetical protein